MNKNIRLNIVSSNFYYGGNIMSEERKDFCIECRRDTEYTFQKVEILKTIRGK